MQRGLMEIMTPVEASQPGRAKFGGSPGQELLGHERLYLAQAVAFVRSAAGKLLYLSRLCNRSAIGHGVLVEI